jgi:hypothetical protein
VADSGRAARRDAADIFMPVDPDAVRMCSGPCGEAKPCTSFPTVDGQTEARHGECRACRDERLRKVEATDVELKAAGDATKWFPLGGRRTTLRAQRSAVADTVLAVMSEHSGQALLTNQVYEEVFDRLPFVPAEADVRNSLRDLAKTDERCVKLGRDAFAWVQAGETPPPPPAPPHVVEMIERRWRGITLDEIGAEYGVTRERVRQLLKKYGGPTANEIRELRAAQALSAQREHEEAVTGVIREALEGRGPATVDEMTQATGIDGGDISKYWPKELAHLRLWGAGQGESRWTDEDICEALRQASVYEFPLTTTAYSDLLKVGQVNGPSVPRIGQRFGSWSAACAAAGVVAGDPWNREYESKWSDEDLVQIARSYLTDPNFPNSAHRFDEWKRENAPDGPSAQTLRNRFGSWTEVKRRALAQGGLNT